ncbi:MAG: DUF362 domain-containing protein [Anaerolineae bacterium]|nr:DUF362 domain-containing protein [Anaerolineae bacterium]
MDNGLQSNDQGIMTRNISRRTFLGWAVAAVAGLVAACGERLGLAPTAAPSPARTSGPTPTLPPTWTPAPTDTPQPTATLVVPPTETLVATSVPTDTPPPTAAPVSRADVMRIYPEVKSRVVVVRHAGACSGPDDIAADVVKQMLDAAIVELTGVDDAQRAWRTLFDPTERIAIKVNTINHYGTSVPLAYAVAEKLQAIGVVAENIVIFDRNTGELQRAGYTINEDGPGVRCWATRGYQEPRDVAGTTQQLSDILLDCDALINLPLLKQHGFSGLSFAMKNHYGSIDRPSAIHFENCAPGIAQLNALPEIRDRTRLIIGDVLRMCPANWDQAVVGNTLLMSFDPVAHDYVGMQILTDWLSANGGNPAGVTGQAKHLATAAALGLGTNDPAHIDWRELVL